MYAHEVFKSYHSREWQKDFYCLMVKNYMDLFRKSLQGINDAVKFHMGKQSEVNHAVSQRLEYADVFSECHFPYPHCWFDYFSDERVESPTTKRIGDLGVQVRSALLCDEVDDGLFTVLHFTALKDPFSWTMDPVVSFAAYKPLLSYESLRLTLPKVPDQGAHVMSCLMTPTADGESPLGSLSDELYYNAGADISTMCRFLRLLNCANSIFVEVNPKNPPASPKKPREPGSFKYAYKLLRLDLGKPRGGVHSLGEIKHLWSNPLHSCRGHFRTYTPEHGLFGKVAGTFWIPPHMRGNADHGVVVKDYEVTR